MVSQPIELAPAAGSGGGVRPKSRWFDTAFLAFVAACGTIVVALALALLALLARTGIRGVAQTGLAPLVTGALWKPEAGLFGGVPLIVGTAATASGALLTGALPALLAAVWVTEFAPERVAIAYRRVLEIAAALPSVVYGWLALEHLVPAMDRVAHAIHPSIADVGGEGIASSAVLLGVMIAPTVALLSLDALARAPGAMREASAALGASPWQTAFSVVVPFAWRGLLTAVFFGFARAAGETMAVQMVIGGARKLPETAFSPTTTISTQIVMDMQNARPGTPSSDALYAMALVLLVLSSAVVLATRALALRGRA